MASQPNTTFPEHSIGRSPGFTDFVDRWIYVFMAGLFIVTTLVGFIPDSLAKIAAVEAGERAPFPPVLHLHAVLMGSWLLLLLTQTTLMATGRPARHKRLGITAMVLAPAIVATGFVLVPTIYGQIWNAAQSAPPEASAQMQGLLAMIGNIALLQIRAGLLFALFVILALKARKTDPGMHKRLIILATVIPLPAAIDRISWIPHSFPEAAYSADLYVLAWIAPMFVWDRYRLGRIHKAYVIWLSVFIPCAIAVHLLWNSAWWQNFVPGLMGYGS